MVFLNNVIKILIFIFAIVICFDERIFKLLKKFKYLWELYRSTRGKLLDLNLSIGNKVNLLELYFWFWFYFYL